jgi:hypothetical protein
MSASNHGAPEPENNLRLEIGHVLFIDLRVHTQLATLDVLDDNPKGALEHVDYRDDPRFSAFCRKLGIENLPPKT